LPLHPLPEADGHLLLGAGADRRAQLPPGSGEELVECWRHPEGGFEKCFCSKCGSHPFSRHPDDPTQMSIRMSAFDGDPGVRPSWLT